MRNSATPAVNIRILQDLNAGVIDEKSFARYVCDIVGSEHYNDNLRQLRGTFGFALQQSTTNVLAYTLPNAGSTAQAFVTVIADGGAADPNQGNLVPLDRCHASFDGGEVDGEELWVLFGLGIETSFPLQTLAAGDPDSAAMNRAGRAVFLSQFSNSRALPLGAVSDWPSTKGGGGAFSNYRNGFTDGGSRSFRPIALKPSTRFHVEGVVCSQPDLGLFAELAANQLISFIVSYRAWRMNIRETFGNAQCRNLFA